MNVIRELIGAVKSGSHSGKGNKSYNKGNYEKALHHYELAVKYNEQGFVGSNPALLEYLAMTHAQLGNLKEALSAAEQALNLFRELGTGKQFITDATGRLKYFIELLRNNDNEKLKEYLSDNETKEI